MTDTDKDTQMQPEEMQAYVQEVAEILGEEKESPIHQIKLILQHMGKEFTEKYVEKALRIEERGGMMTDDGKRRRTLGGVFFYITKTKLPEEIRSEIFPNYGQMNKGKVVQWEERLEHLQPLLEKEAGHVRTVNITIQGRPQEVKIIEDSVMFTLAYTPKTMPVPRGVPTLPNFETKYTVYMAIKHWEPVVDFLERYKKDRLIIEGPCMLDAETGTIAVFAMQVTTWRAERQARKEAQKAEEEEKKKQAAADTTAKKETKPRASKSENGREKRAVEVDIPDGMSDADVDKLRQLASAAQTLRERVADMEEKGKAGVAMTKKLLSNTEKQMHALKKKYS